MLQLSLTYKASYKTCLARVNYNSFHGAKGYLACENIRFSSLFVAEKRPQRRRARRNGCFRRLKDIGTCKIGPLGLQCAHHLLGLQENFNIPNA